MTWTQSARGFTLLELLVALAITAGIAVLSWQFIDGAIRASEQGDAVLHEVDALEGFWQAFDMDLQQSRAPFLVNDEATDMALPGYGTGALAFAGGESEVMRALTLPATGAPWLYLRRETGEHPGLPQRPGMQRVLYSLREGTLVRQSWTERYLPDAHGQAQLREMASGITDLSVRFLARQSDSWSEVWPPGNAALPETVDAALGPQALLPQALILTLHTEALGDVERLFVLPGS